MVRRVVRRLFECSGPGGRPDETGIGWSGLSSLVHGTSKSPGLSAQLPHGRDLHLRTTKWSRGRKQKYTSTQIPSHAWGRCRSIQKRLKDWTIKWKNFRQSDSYREFFGIDGESIEVEWNIFPGLTFIGDPPEDPKRPERSKHWAWKVPRSNHLHVNFQWHRLDKQRKFRKMYFKFRTSQELHGEIIARDIGNSTARETKRSGTEHPAIHIMGNGIPSPHKWWKHSTKPVTQYSRVSVLWVVEFGKGKMAERPYTSMRNHRRQNSYFAQFTQVISSVSTAQS